MAKIGVFLFIVSVAIFLFGPADMAADLVTVNRIAMGVSGLLYGISRIFD